MRLTSAPRFASSSAICAPMPLEAPETKATLPLSSILLRGDKSVFFFLKTQKGRQTGDLAKQNRRLN